MARHSLTLSEQITGIKAALHSRRTPVQLRPALQRRLQKLERLLGKQPRSRARRKPKFLGWFSL
jgi:hypothetical protein